MVGGIIAFSAAAVAAASSPGTDFGVRQVGYGPAVLTVESVRPLSLSSAPSSSERELPISLPTTSSIARSGGSYSLAAAAALGRHWGIVTSTYRSPAHNRRVGGVANSFHLSGRAVDIARRPGVNHQSIVAAYRNAGYRIVEALDEGDHTHIAFSFGGSGGPIARPSQQASNGSTNWGIVYAPGSR